MSAEGSSFVRTADGTDLYVKDWGRGPALLFVHSLGLNNEVWQYQHAYFCDAGFRVVAFDRRGHGRSDQPGEGYDADTLADDLAQVIAARALENVTLIGHSMGCLEIVRYLVRHGSGRVSRAVLAGTTTPSPLKSASNPDGLDAGVVEALRNRWSTDFPGWVADNARAFVMPDTSQALLDTVVTTMSAMPVKVMLDCNRTVFWNDFTADCRAVSVPTLVVHGTADASTPIALTGQPTAALIPGSRLKVYEEAPHGLTLTHVERLNADIAAFVTGG